MVYNPNILQARERRLNQSSFNRQQRVQELTKQRANEALYIKNVTEEANRLNLEFEKINFGGNIDNYINEYKKIEQINPDIAKRLKYNPQTIKKELDNRINYVLGKIDYSKQREERYDEKDNKAKEKQYRAEKRAYEEALNKLKQGSILSISDINSYASDQGRNARKKQEAKDKAKEIQLKSPTLKPETQTYRVITNPEVFITSQAQAYNSASPEQRKEIQNNLLNNYGSDVLTSVVAGANSLRTVGKIDEKTINLTTDFISSKTGGGRTTDLIDDIYKQQVNRDLIVQGLSPLNPASSINTYLKKEEELNNLIKNNQTPFLSSLRKNVQLDKNFYNLGYNELNNNDKRILENKFLTGQTVTPNEVRLYQKLIEDRNKQLFKDQVSAKEIRKATNKAIEVLKKARGLKVSDIKEIKSEIVAKSKQAGEIIKGVDLNTIKRLFVSKESESAFNKALNGNTKDISVRESIGLGVDLVGLIPVAKAGKLGVKVIRNKIANKIGNITLKGAKEFQNASKIRQYVRFTNSIINNAGTGLRVYQATQEALKVDNKYLSDKAKVLGFKNERALYDTYLGEVQNQFKDKTIKIEDLGFYLGADLSSAKAVSKAQEKFSKYLKDNGFSDKDIQKTLANLENKRVSRVVGQIVGALAIEISSERLADKLIKEGVKKQKAVGIAGVREFWGVLASEAYVQENNITPTDLAGALLFGAVFTASPLASQFFSMSKYKKLTKKEIESAREKLAKKLNSKLTKTKKENYANKFLKKLKSDVKVENLNKKELNALSSTYIKNSLTKFRDKRTSIAKQRLILRDPIGNLLDIYELPGDYIYDLSQKIKNKLLKQKTIKRKKVKSISTTINRAISKAVNKAKASTKAKATTKAKASTKAKATTKAKASTKAKATTKAKAVTKAKATTKAKTKVKTIIIPDIRKRKAPKSMTKELLTYNLEYKLNNKPKIFVLNKPLNKSLDSAINLISKNKSIKEIKLVKGRKLKVNDNKSKPLPKNLKLLKGKDIILRRIN